MSDNDLRAICAAATPGPWRADGEDIYADAQSSTEPLLCGDWVRDAEFIAAARDAVPRLLDAVDRVRALHVNSGEGGDHCQECVLAWPCPTVIALEATMSDTCAHRAEAYDVNHGWHWRRCDRPAGHDGPHHPAAYAGTLDVSVSAGHDEQPG